MKKSIQNLIIFGSGPHAILSAAESLKIYRIKKIYFFDNISSKSHLKISNKKYKIINEFTQLNKFINPKSFFFIGVGNNKIRRKIYHQILKKYKKVNWLTVLSKNSNIDKSVKIGEGTLVMPGVTLNYNCSVGKFNIINTNSSIDHDCVLKDFISIGPGANLAGNVKIFSVSSIGIGSSVRENIKVDERVVIGGSSFVNKNCEKNCLYFGVPIKKIRANKKKN